MLKKVLQEDCIREVESELIKVHRLKHLKPELLEEWEYNQIIQQLALILSSVENEDEFMVMPKLKDGINEENVRNYGKLPSIFNPFNDFEDEVEEVDEMLWHDLQFIGYYTHEILEEE